MDDLITVLVTPTEKKKPDAVGQRSAVTPQVT